MRSAVVRGAARAVTACGLVRPLSIAIGHVRGAALPILSYHRVNDDGDPFFPSLGTRVFERHMAVVARAYRVQTVEALVERMTRGTLPPNALAITFDDGYRDTLTHAAPILARHGLPATVFLATGFIGNAELPWFDRLALAFKLTSRSDVAAPWGERASLTSTERRLAALDRTLEHVKGLPDDERRATVDGLLEQLGVEHERGGKGPMLTWDDVHALAAHGFSIGAHTVNHPILSRVDAQRAWTEIVGSRAMIESACGAAPAAFAYPNGGPQDYTERDVRLVREAGFACAVTTRFGMNGPRTSAWQLRRGGPWEHDAATFALKLAAYRLSAGASTAVDA